MQKINCCLLVLCAILASACQADHAQTERSMLQQDLNAAIARLNAAKAEFMKYVTNKDAGWIPMADEELPSEMSLENAKEYVGNRVAALDEQTDNINYYIKLNQLAQANDTAAMRELTKKHDEMMEQKHHVKTIRGSIKDEDGKVVLYEQRRRDGRTMKSDEEFKAYLEKRRAFEKELLKAGRSQEKAKAILKEYYPDADPESLSYRISEDGTRVEAVSFAKKAEE